MSFVVRTGCALLGLFLWAAVAAAEPPTSWTSFRGPTGQGFAGDAKLPLTWSETKNVTWKTPVPGRAWSSPVVLDGKVWFTNAPAGGKRLSVVCLDAKTGKKIHDVTVFEVDKHERVGNKMNSYASPTPVVEAGRVYATFGRDGTVCIDTQTGKVLWKRTDLVVLHMEGAGSSPVLVGDVLILTFDGTDEQFIVGLDKNTGKTRWTTPRSIDMKSFPKHARKAYSTPLVVEHNGRAEVIIGGAQCVMGYEPATGKELWRVRWKTGWSNGATPFTADGMVYVNTGFGKGNISQMLAIRLGGSGDVTDTHIAWRFDKQVSHRGSGIAIDGRIYAVSDTGMLMCLDTKTGKEIYRQRLEADYSASVIHASGRLYFFDHEGRSTVVQPGPTFKTLATGQLDEGFMASGAVVGNTLFLRTKTHVYRIEEKP